MPGSITVPMNDEAYLAMARETPLPEDGAPSTNPAEPATSSSSSNGRYNSELSALPLPPTSFPASRRLKRRAPPAEIQILEDPNTASGPPTKKPATARKDGRTPLGERKDFGNACPRTPATPDSTTPSVEGWNRYRHHFTPRTPRTPQPRSQAPRVIRLTTEPADKRLYSFLELHDWRVTTKEIRAAYKNVAKKYHPDKVSTAQQQDAHYMMVLINAARDVLLDKEARTKYHRDGVLPHVFAEFDGM
ncbi:hypothetical protein N0V90_004262 [Kalmusia sp. IMI 367209]|nr:hypothetical protein N0V90_004262 [Kalmusia sp. IMI 367209]